MKKKLRTVCLLLFVCVICSCASQPVVPPSSAWRYEKDALNFYLKADSQLNLYEGMPHTLHICVYQLRDPNTFNQFSEDTNGLYKLLECGRFDTSVASSKRFFIQPGETKDFALDRAEGAKYVALVAGYSLLQKEGLIRLFEIPIISERTGMLKLSKVTKPGPLNVHLILGSHEIQKIEGNSTDE
ncbi:MAG: type VI secretion system lipoprotein TssJ [Thermodesulfobacteriota bacterium]|nr:type VI secretion system lipoprotein TssJ [Thermodesulfobacteriota bacterium]